MLDFVFENRLYLNIQIWIASDMFSQKICSLKLEYFLLFVRYVPRGI